MHVSLAPRTDLTVPQDRLSGAPVQVRTLDWTDSTDPEREGFVRTLLDEVDANVILAADVVRAENAVVERSPA